MYIGNIIVYGFFVNIITIDFSRWYIVLFIKLDMKTIRKKIIEY